MKLRSSHWQSATTALLLLGTFSTASLAEGVSVGHVMGFIHDRSDRVTVYVSPPTTGAPSCVIYNDRFALDISTAGGRAAYTALLAAMHARTPVNAHGTGTCDLYPNSETLGWFVANPW